MERIELRDLISLAEDFIYHASIIDDEKKPAFDVIVDQLDSTLSKHINEVQNTSGCKNHWINAIENCETRVFPKNLTPKEFHENGEKDFLALAIEAHLLFYVSRKLETQPELIKAKRGRPYLDYALRPSIFNNLEIRLNMVAILLRNGANPNQVVRIYGNVTVWALFLQMMYARRAQIHFKHQTESWFQVTRVLIEYGANPALCMGENKVTVFHILETVFSQAQWTELRPLLMKCQGFSLQQWLGWTENVVDWPRDEMLS